MTAIGITASALADYGRFVPILLQDNRYILAGTTLGEHSFDTTTQVALTTEVLNVFAGIRRTVIETDDIRLSESRCEAALRSLATWGSRAYRRLFSEEQARTVLASRLRADGHPAASPTFLSKSVRFPWEVLHDGADADRYLGDAEGFWGFRLAPARVPEEGRDVSMYSGEQALPTDMLMCVHHQLRFAHDQEWPAIHRAVCASERDACTLLRAPEFASVTSGEMLLKHLYGTRHNMLHFACHCVEGVAGSDVLQVSVISDQGANLVIELETWMFVDISEGRFQRAPLVFLNACESAGGADVLRVAFNLPRTLVEHNAGAVIATACPVPDSFAAAFASCFYDFFLTGTVDAPGGVAHPLAIGEALRRTRRHFLDEYRNPLGLAYGLYTPAHYRVAETPRARIHA